MCVQHVCVFGPHLGDILSNYVYVQNQGNLVVYRYSLLVNALLEERVNFFAGVIFHVLHHRGKARVAQPSGWCSVTPGCFLLVPHFHLVLCGCFGVSCVSLSDYQSMSPAMLPGYFAVARPQGCINRYVKTYVHTSNVFSTYGGTKIEPPWHAAPPPGISAAM